jgi:hypothetical protein
VTATHGLWRYYQGHRYILELTPLNRRLSAAYARCGDRHRASGETVTRDVKGQPVIFQVCKRCGCPWRRG